MSRTASTTTRRAARSLVPLLACALAAGFQMATPAHAETRDEHRSPSWQAGRNSTLPVSTRVGASATADITPTQLLAQVNTHRARYGVPAISYATADVSALNAHANYIRLNMKSDDDLSTEEQEAPGYTAAGADIAPYTLGSDAASWSEALHGWMSDPWLRDANLLEPTATSLAVGSSGTVRVFAMSFTGEPATGYPRSFPTGANNTLLTNGATWLVDSYGCDGKGFPLTASWDPQTYGLPTSTSGSLKADGATVASCTVAPADADSAEVALVPTAALRPGTHYTGTLAATMDLLAGGSASVTRTLDFTTAAPATRIAGDQSGDRAADLFAVTSAGELKLYKGRADGTLGHGWQVGTGWGSTDWLAMAGDLNGDGRSDLLSRRTDGTLWRHLSSGMGTFQAAKQVGHGFGSLSKLAVLGDIGRDGTRDLVGVAADGTLKRYAIGASSLTSGGVIGTGWGTASTLLGVGSMNGDAVDDLVAIMADGTMRLYSMTATGRFSTMRQIGHGWGGMLALTMGDANADGRLDLMVRRSDGTMSSYLNRGTSWAPAVKAGTGFGGFRLLA